jgi:predicted protein tyrosine phosphatase
MKSITILGRHDVEILDDPDYFVWPIDRNRTYAYLSISDTPRTKVDSPLIHNKNCKGYFHVAFMDSEHEDYIYKRVRSLRDKQAEQIADFILSVWNDVEVFVAQCEAGISRSAGVAKAIDDVLNGGTLHIGLPNYNPNMLVYNKVRKALMEKVV